MTAPRMFLQKGAHKTLEDGACAMEVSAWLAGEPHSDSPVCVDAGIAAFVRRRNDVLPDDPRQELLPYCIRVLGTRSSREIAIRRGFMFADWAVREALPLVLEAQGKQNEALVLRALPELVDRATCIAGQKAAQKVRADAAADAAYAAYAAAADAADAAYAAYAAADADAADADADAAYAAAYADVKLTHKSSLALLDRVIALSNTPDEAVCVAPERCAAYELALRA